jgi:SagB-type dehydrogenase family enzyme|tara:strand:+ start:1542 stop:2336 length:795 start_codon:yes stop_codon:yes gene_type:complete
MTEENTLQNYHQLLKADEWAAGLDSFNTDQTRNTPRPDVQKISPPNAEIFPLTPPEEFSIGQKPVIDVIRERRSHRYFTEQPLTLQELSFLLWATQGIRATTTFDGITYYLRNVPSGGNRHPIETYLNIHRVEGFAAGLYRYRPVEHDLVLLREGTEICEEVSIASLEQASEYQGKPFYFIRDCAVVFIWAAVPYRSEWRYGPAGPKLIALDSGHICQNLYVACGAIDLGTCAIGAFNRQKMDAVLQLDGEEEFSFYMAPVGKI